MKNKCYWGSKDAEDHFAQCLTSCHNPKVRTIVTDERCIVCPYREIKKRDIKKEVEE